LHQNNLQLQNQAALMTCQIGYEQSSLEIVRLDYTPVCKIESC